MLEYAEGIRHLFREVSYYFRLAVGWGSLSRRALEPDPVGMVRRYLANREANFLKLARQAIFDRPANPYFLLFEWAGCEYGDLERGVRRDGLEESLRSLHQQGVWLSHDEFKGKKPIMRGSRQMQACPSDFANPGIRGVIETRSSGSRSGGTVTRQGPEYHFYREAQEQVLLRLFHIERRKRALMSSILPSTGGVRRSVLWARRGMPPDRWFALGGRVRDSGHYRMMTKLLMLEANLLGVRAISPTYLPYNDFSPVAHWIAGQRAAGEEVLLAAGVSSAVRVAAAAHDAGLDIRDTVVRVYGEALTEAKRAAIETAGAKPYPDYTISEVGKIGGACPEMTEGNCVHVCRDSVAVIGYRRRAPLTDVEVDSLLFTTLLPFAPTALINVEMDDSGVVGPAGCNCDLKAMGLNQQVSHIYSFGKLTGQGITLIGEDVLPILERKMPARFGGVPTDYQLVEMEGSNQTEIELRVDPRVGIASGDEVKNYFLSELGKVYGGSLSRRTWVQTNGIRVVFAVPYRTRNSDKVHALHLLGAAVNREDS